MTIDFEGAFQDANSLRADTAAAAAAHARRLADELARFHVEVARAGAFLAERGAPVTQVWDEEPRPVVAALRGRPPRAEPGESVVYVMPAFDHMYKHVWLVGRMSSAFLVHAGTYHLALVRGTLWTYRSRTARNGESAGIPRFVLDVSSLQLDDHRSFLGEGHRSLLALRDRESGTERDAFEWLKDAVVGAAQGR